MVILISEKLLNVVPFMKMFLQNINIREWYFGM